MKQITKVTRVPVKGGFQFKDQDGVVLRKKAARPYTHMSVNKWNGLDGAFLRFHSTPNPSPVHPTSSILQIIPIEEEAR